MKVLILAAALGAAPAYACVDVAKSPTILDFTGVLEKHDFPSPASIQGATHSNAPLVTYILRVPKKICASGGYADAKKLFDDIQVSSRSEKAVPWLASHIGQRVTVKGEVVPALTAWHKAPLVLLLPEDWPAKETEDDDTELHR